MWESRLETFSFKNLLFSVSVSAPTIESSEDQSSSISATEPSEPSAMECKDTTPTEAEIITTARKEAASTSEGFEVIESSTESTTELQEIKSTEQNSDLDVA